MEERTFAFDVDRAVEHLDRILQMELAGVIYYTHYSFMIYGHARIPITSWLGQCDGTAGPCSGGRPDDYAATQKAVSRHRRTTYYSAQYNRRIYQINSARAGWRRSTSGLERRGRDVIERRGEGQHALTGHGVVVQVDVVEARDREARGVEHGALRNRAADEHFARAAGRLHAGTRSRPRRRRGR